MLIPDSNGQGQRARPSDGARAITSAGVGMLKKGFIGKKR